MPITARQMAQLRRRRRVITSGFGWPVFNPPPGLWIRDGAPNYTPRDFTQYVVAYSPSIKSTISPYAGIFRCQLDGPASVMSTVKVEQELTWSRDGVTYAGRIRSIIPVDQVIASANVTLAIDCQDFTTLLDSDVCAYAVSPQVSPNRTIVETDAQRISWLVQSFGRQGITLHHVQQNYATVPATDYTGMTLKKAIESVLAYSGGSLFVDYAKDLHCFLDERQYAPFTLGETPDGATSFEYGGLQLPSDSVDLRNAIYGIGAPFAALVSESITPVAPTGSELVLATFKAAEGQQIAQVGELGAFIAGAPTTVTPTFGQPTVAGHHLVAWVTADNGEPKSSSGGWQKAISAQANTGQWVSLWYKPNCAAGETTPTFTNAGGVVVMFAQLAEFSGVAITNPLDQTGSANPTGTYDKLGAVATANDSARGNLILGASIWKWSGISAATPVATFGGGSILVVHAGDYPNADLDTDAGFNYGIALRGSWYTDEASIALYGRREASFIDNTATNQADLDALGAAALAENAQPRQEGSFVCWRPGLAVGQRFTIQSSLYTLPVIVDPLGNYTGIVQSVTITYPEDEPSPKFEVEFLKPTVTLAVQLGEIVAKLTEVIPPSSEPGDFISDFHLLQSTKAKAPTIAAVAGMTAIALENGSTDTVGRITFTPSGAVAAGAVICTLTFGTAFDTQPFCICSSSRGQSSGTVIDPYWAGSTATLQQFVAGTGGLTGGVQYSIDYIIVGRA